MQRRNKAGQQTTTDGLIDYDVKNGLTGAHVRTSPSQRPLSSSAVERCAVERVWQLIFHQLTISIKRHDGLTIAAAQMFGGAWHARMTRKSVVQHHRRRRMEQLTLRPIMPGGQSTTCAPVVDVVVHQRSRLALGRMSGRALDKVSSSTGRRHDDDRRIKTTKLRHLRN